MVLLLGPNQCCNDEGCFLLLCCNFLSLLGEYFMVNRDERIFKIRNFRKNNPNGPQFHPISLKLVYKYAQKPCIYSFLSFFSCLLLPSHALILSGSATASRIEPKKIRVHGKPNFSQSLDQSSIVLFQFVHL